MAADSAAFTALGEIEIDQAKLTASLSRSEQLVTASVQRQAASLKRVGDGQQLDMFSNYAKGATQQLDMFTEAARGAAAEAPKIVPDDVPAKLENVGHHGHSAGSQLSHMSRIIREMVTGPLAVADPALARLAGGMGAAARSARFYGVSAGLGIIAAVGMSEAFGLLAERARAQSEAMFEVQRSIDALDLGRMEKAFDKSGESIAKLNFAEEELSSKSTTFLQKALAWFDLLKDRVTGSTDQTISKLGAQGEAFAKLYAEIEVPKANIEGLQKLADAEKESALEAMKNAASEEDAVTASERAITAAREGSFQKMRSIDLEEKQELRSKVDAVTDAARKRIQAEIESLEQQKALAQEAAATAGASPEMKAQVGRLVALIQDKNHQLEDVERTSTKIREEIATKWAEKRLDVERELATQVSKISLEGVAAVLEAAKKESDAQQQVIDALSKVETSYVETKQKIIETQHEIDEAERTHSAKPPDVTAVKNYNASILALTLARLNEEDDRARQVYEEQRGLLEKQVDSYSKLAGAARQAGQTEAQAQNNRATAAGKAANAQEQLDTLDTKYSAEQVSRADKVAQAKIDGAKRAYDAIRKALDEQIRLEDAYEKFSVSVGQQTLSSHQTYLEESVADERRSVEQRRSAYEGLLSFVTSTYEKFVSALRSSNDMSSAEATRAQADLVGIYEAGSAQRLEVEQRLAGSVRQLFQDLKNQAKDIVSTGLDASKGIFGPGKFDATIARLKEMEEAYKNLKMPDQAEGIAQQREMYEQAKAQETLIKSTAHSNDELVASNQQAVEWAKAWVVAMKNGAQVPDEIRSKIEQIANAQENAIKTGAAGTQAMSVHMDDLLNKLTGVKDTTKSEAEEMNKVGIVSKNVVEAVKELTDTMKDWVSHMTVAGTLARGLDFRSAESSATSASTSVRALAEAARGVQQAAQAAGKTGADAMRSMQDSAVGAGQSGAAAVSMWKDALGELQIKTLGVDNAFAATTDELGNVTERATIAGTSFEIITDAMGKVTIRGQGIKSAMDDIANSAQSAGQKAASSFSGVESATNAAVASMSSSAATMASKVVSAFDFSSKLQASVGASLDSVLPLFDAFADKAVARIQAGMSRIADAAYSTFASRLQQQLDALALAS